MPLVPATGTISYNGYTFGPYTTTESIEARPVQDSAQRTVKYVVYLIRLKSKIYYFSPGGTQAATETTMQDIRRRLTTQGGAFRYLNKGFGNLSINVSGTKDVIWGPIPKILSWKPLGGDLASEITWQVQVAIPECSSAKFVFPFPMEFCFSVTYAIDRAGYTRRTYKGFVTIPQTRKSVNDRTIAHTADELREKIWIEPPLGMRLEFQTYTIVEDKCRLEFEIVHEDMPTALPPYVIDCHASHHVQSGNKAFVNWTSTINAEYELDRSVPRSYAYQLFFELVSSRRQASLLFGNSNPTPILISFSATEPNIYGRPISRFSLTYTYGADASRFLAASGLFRSVPGTNAKLWKASLLNTAMHPRGYGKMKFNPGDDAIIDLCAQPANIGSGPTIVNDNRIVKDIFQTFKCPPPDKSWLFYDLKLKTTYEDETCIIRCLPETPISPFNYALKTYGFGMDDGENPDAVENTITSGNATEFPYPVASMHSQLTSDIQVRTPVAILFTLEGSALRACWPIQPPNLLKVGSALAVPVRRSDNFFKTWLIRNTGIPINAATWRQSYFIYGNPGLIGVVPNPYLS